MTYLAPFAGPAGGGSRLTLRGRALGDYGGAICRFFFPGEAISSQTVASTPASAHGAARDLITCHAPPLDGTRLAALRLGTLTRVDIRLSLNGELQQLAAATLCSGPPLPTNTSCYEYFDAAAVGLSALEPRGGPHHGGTQVVLRGVGFSNYGGVGCKFGHLPIVPAELLAPDQARCASPANGPLPSTGRLRVHITLN